MPAVPAFAGDLQSDGALATRAIMEFQYASISRGGYSILEKLKKGGIEQPERYIGFYNLRNFDRINTSQTMKDAERRAGVPYEQARKEHDDKVGSSQYPQGEGTRGRTEEYEKYQKSAAQVSDDTMDTITSCYMQGGRKLVDIPWYGNPEDEINAFVSEELYIHSKLLIADDRLTICGSANLNDRSQLGTHDSEIAVVIEDGPSVVSQMNEKPFTVSQFATTLRRQLFRKHLGMIPDQRWEKPEGNWLPLANSPNLYDWGSDGDRWTADPLHPQLLQLWADVARQNTEIFSRAFHPVPNDHVRTWKDYDDFFSKHFIVGGAETSKEKGKGGNEGDKAAKKNESDKVEYGHIVRGEFPGGVQEVKQWLSGIRGTLVDMPLDFLVDVDDIAKNGLTLNSLTEEIYT